MVLSFPSMLWLPYSAFILKAFSRSQSPLAEEMEKKRNEERFPGLKPNGGTG